MRTQANTSSKKDAGWNTTGVCRIRINSARTLIAAFFCIPSALFADDSLFPFSAEGRISAAAEVKQCSLYEYVFSGARKKSELDWRSGCFPTAGADAEVTFAHTIRVSAALDYGAGGSPGSVNDSDWNAEGGLSDYHHHSVRLERALDADLSAGWIFRPFTAARLIPYAQIGYTDIRMTAHDGYAQAPAAPKTDTPGKIMAYRQRYILPAFGVKAEYDIGRFTVSGWGRYGAFGRCEAVDSHYSTGFEYHDAFNAARRWDIGASVNCRIFERLFVGVCGSIMEMPHSRGNSYSVNMTTGERSSTFRNCAGAGMKSQNVTLSAGILF